MREAALAYKSRFGWLWIGTIALNLWLIVAKVCCKLHPGLIELIEMVRIRNTKVDFTPCWFERNGSFQNPPGTKLPKSHCHLLVIPNETPPGTKLPKSHCHLLGYRTRKWCRRYQSMPWRVRAHTTCWSLKGAGRVQGYQYRGRSYYTVARWSRRSDRWRLNMRHFSFFDSILTTRNKSRSLQRQYQNCSSMLAWRKKCKIIFTGKLNWQNLHNEWNDRVVM